MTPTVHIAYKGDLRTEASHLQSGEKIYTDAPKDNQGKGEAFSPTDLVASALGSCMMTIMGIRARDNEISIEGIEMDITKIMASDPRKITKIIAIIKMPTNDLSADQKALLENAAKTCPVALSLHEDIIQEITFKY